MYTINIEVKVVDDVTLLQIFQDHKDYLLPLANGEKPLLRFINTNYLFNENHEFNDFCYLAKQAAFYQEKNIKNLFVLLDLRENRYGSILLFQDKANPSDIAIISLNTFIIDQSLIGWRGLITVPQSIVLPTWLDVILDGDIDPTLQEEKQSPYNGKRQLYKNNQQLLNICRRQSTNYIIDNKDPIKKAALLIDGSFDCVGVRGKKISPLNAYCMPVVCNLDNAITIHFDGVTESLILSYTNEQAKKHKYLDQLKIETDEKSSVDEASIQNQITFYRPFAKESDFSIKLKHIHYPKRQLVTPTNKDGELLVLDQRKSTIILNRNDDLFIESFYFNKRYYSEALKPIKWIIKDQKEISIHFKLNDPPKLAISNWFLSKTIQASSIVLDGKNFYRIDQSSLPFYDRDDLKEIQIYTKFNTSVSLQPIDDNHKILTPMSAEISVNPLFANIYSVLTVKKSAQTSCIDGHLLLTSSKPEFSIGIRARDIYGATSSLYHLSVKAP